MTTRKLKIACPNPECENKSIDVVATIQYTTAKYGKPILKSVDYPSKAPCCGAILDHMSAMVYDATDLALVGDDEH